jgi:hypothetical protein
LLMLSPYWAIGISLLINVCLSLYDAMSGEANDQQG